MILLRNSALDRRTTHLTYCSQFFGHRQVDLSRSQRDPLQSNKNLTVEQKLVLWHRQLAHAELPVVKEVMKSYDLQVQCPVNFELPFCDVCVKSKLTMKTFDKVRTLPTRPAEVIAADLIGLVALQTFPHGYKFILVIIDVFSKYARVFVLKSKSETHVYLKPFLNMARSQHPTPGQLKIFRSDGGDRVYQSQSTKSTSGIWGRTTDICTRNVSA